MRRFSQLAVLPLPFEEPTTGNSRAIDNDAFKTVSRF